MQIKSCYWRKFTVWFTSDLLQYLFFHNVCSDGVKYQGCFSDLFDYSLDPEQKDMLIEVIEKLLADKTTVRLDLNSFSRFLILNLCIRSYVKKTYVYMCRM